MVRSRVDGRSWSQPENMTRKLKRAEWWLLATSPQAGIQLVDGTLVMPVQGRDENQKEFSTLMTSRDHGANWAVGTPASRGVSECEAAALDDGSIMLNMRNEAKDDTFHYRAVYVTRDLGRTWQPHGPDRNRLIEPGCNGSLLRFDYDEAGEKKHVLLFSNPHTWEGRTHQTVQVSFDDGLTWPRDNYFLLDEGLGAGYLLELDSGSTRHRRISCGIVYEGSQSDLVFQVIRAPGRIAQALMRPAGTGLIRWSSSIRPISRSRVRRAEAGRSIRRIASRPDWRLRLHGRRGLPRPHRCRYCRARLKPAQSVKIRREGSKSPMTGRWSPVKHCRPPQR